MSEKYQNPDAFFDFSDKCDVLPSPSHSGFCSDDFFGQFPEDLLDVKTFGGYQDNTKIIGTEKYSQDISSPEESAYSTGVSAFNSLPHSEDFPSQKSQKAVNQGREESTIVTFSNDCVISFMESSESQPEKKRKMDGNQSIYKNKYKETLEQGKSIIGELLKCDFEHYERIVQESEKDNETWKADIDALAHSINKLAEIENKTEEAQDKIEESESQEKKKQAIKKELPKLKKQIKELEGELKRACGKKEERKIGKKIEKVHKKEEDLKEELRLLELNECSAEESKDAKNQLKKLKESIKPFQVRILKALEYKRYALFAPLFEVREEIKSFVGKRSAGFFESYKKQRSMKFFEKDMSQEELFYWAAIFKVVLVLLPQDQETLDMSTLTKGTTPFMCWLVDSSVMKMKHKALFKEHSVRMHLRREFEKTFAKLMKKANETMAPERLEALNKIMGLFGGVGEFDLSGLEGSPSTKESLERELDDFEFDFGFDMELEQGCLPRKIYKYD